MAIPVISKLKPANNGDFPVVDAHDVDMGDNQRLDQVADYLKQALDECADIVDGHTTDIAVISKDVSDCKTQVDKNLDNINELSDKEAADRRQINQNTNSILNLENTTNADRKKIDQNTNDIGALAEKMEECESKVSENSEDITNVSKEVSDSKEVINKNKTDIAALDTKLNANIPDDETVGSQPWTSKHIIDMLCPPLEVSGNPVQCYPVPGYPLGITASWEPVQEGSGDPSPDNIRPIKGRDRVKVTRCGQNLVQPIFYNAPYDVEVGGLIDVHRMEKVSDDAITVSEYTYTNSGGSWSSPMSMIVTIHGNSKYTISGNVSGDGFRAGWYVLDKDGVVTQRSENWTTVPPIQITTSSTDAYLIWYINSIGESVSIDRPMIVLGDVVPTEYVPYTGNTVTLTLPETIYGGSVDAASGEGQKEWKILTLDGNVLKFSVSKTNDLYWNLPSFSAPGITSASRIINSHFGAGMLVVNDRYEFIFTTSNTMGRLFDTCDELNAYISEQYTAGTPVQIAYKLDEPVAYEVAGAETMTALSGINTVLTDADSVAVTGREDLLHVLSGIQSSE